MNSSQKTKLTSIQGDRKTEWVVPDQLLQAQGYGKGQHSFWVPKHMRSACPTTSQRRTSSRQTNQRPQSRRKSPRIQKCWVPKELLEAQGYYKGVCNVWIPRRVPNESSPMHKPDTKLPLGNQQKSRTVSKQWQPKQISTTPVLQEKTIVTTIATTSRTVKGLSMSHPYQAPLLGGQFLLATLTSTICRAQQLCSHNSTTCQHPPSYAFW